MPVRYTLTDNYVLLKGIEGKNYTAEDFVFASEKYVEYAKEMAAAWAHKQVCSGC